MSMYIGVSGLKAATTDLNTTSQNIANASTTGFKNSRAEFGDLVDSNAVMGGGLGVQTQAVNQQFQQGSVITTSNALDLAIVGNGFFGVGEIGGTAATSYTRAGSFHLDPAGNVVNNLGQQLYSGTPLLNTPVKITATPQIINNIQIDNNGKITATDAAGVAATVTGSPLNIVTFPNPQGLKQISDTEWKQDTLVSGAAIPGPPNSPLNGSGNLMSGALEASNVDLTDQLVNMIIAQRNFQANSKTITTNNTLTETITNMIR